MDPNVNTSRRSDRLSPVRTFPVDVPGLTPRSSPGSPALLPRLRVLVRGLQLPHQPAQRGGEGAHQAAELGGPDGRRPAAGPEERRHGEVKVQSALALEASAGGIGGGNRSQRRASCKFSCCG